MSLDEFLELTRRAEASHFWFRGFRRFVAPLLERAAGGRRDLSILDCGCGTGYNLRELSRYGHAVGLDLTASGLAMARVAGSPLAQGDATRLPFVSRHFDLVTSFDMLQCVDDDRRAVEEIARVLKPAGCFVGTVAALEILRGDHALFSKEVKRYSKGGLLRLLSDAGFDPLVVRYAFASIFPIVLGLRALQRLRGARAATRDLALPPAPINAALTAVVSVEAALAPRVAPPVGSSLVFLARQKRRTPPK